MSPEAKEKKRQRDADWRSRNAEKRRDYQRQWRAAHVDTELERSRRWRENNPDRARDLKFRSAYKITLDQYNEMLARQGSVCAICKGPHRGRGKYFHVDHDHKTGVVRGLLCGDCNFGLGFFHDEPSLLMVAKEYLCR